MVFLGDEAWRERKREARGGDRRYSNSMKPKI